MRIHLMRVIIIIIASTIFLYGCGQGKPTIKDQINAATNSPKVTVTGSPAPTLPPSPTPKEETTLSIQTYFTTSNLDKLVAKSQTIRFTSTNSKYLEALNMLKTSPDTQLVSLFTGFKFLAVEATEGKVVVNLTYVETSQLGAGGEVLLLEALEKTLFQFPEIKSIDILVDGKKEQSLMGHMDLPHPIVKK